MGQISKWFGTGAITVSALMVSLKIEWALTWWAFIGFLIGHIIWAVSAFKMREWSLFALNFSFLFIDAYAIGVRI